MSFIPPEKPLQLAKIIKAGSAGIINSTARVSTAITPTGIPPSRARPVTTVNAQPDIISCQEPRSKKPSSHKP
ncbi:hypothetical protein DERP_009640 [Dermatophagoides pteronyssinus]|uniref:Uncharacterized protein n=1 Tax=Dermatophagoides pteronyssinus TaxID=6956 RepID=A0ABQ8JB08_DERPT|nr:hypothetical protein DERP_009640 [Dermatophagoides pteronyssinus]